ncbi:kinetochore Sim4 complex subunit Fta4 [Xylariaceae sp. FL0016]|nr:kinetochore Sim4 complex subunit Fta4 [Xylariaceae sp. FL0016]
MAPPTILAHKSAFLSTQTLYLSQPLAPSHAFRQSNGRSAQALPDRLIDDALYRLNHSLQQHARRVYAPQASRHVAEQIEGLFLEAGERAVRGEDSDEDEDDADGVPGQGGSKLRIGTDFTTDSAIASLPAEWASHDAAEAAARPLEARRYAELQPMLASLSARRREARQRVERLRRMRDMLAPFADGVQENLVTRNGEVEKELERMRVLLVRVAGRVAQLPDTAHEEGGTRDQVMEDVDVAEREKVERLLEGF